MTPFLFLFGLDVLIAASVAYATVSLARVPVVTPMHLSPWLFAISLVLAVLMGALQLQRSGHPRLAIGVLLIPAIPAILGFVALIGVMVLFTLGTPHH
ncbi:hypothetical protein [Muricoccus radiodurans]|uniref:hypothetical protein n=1 Tax=Muricoccus radiodurans TaxID=2231721 RepID=UPI003CF9BE06